MRDKDMDIIKKLYKLEHGHDMPTDEVVATVRSDAKALHIVLKDTDIDTIVERCGDVKTIIEEIERKRRWRDFKNHPGR